MEWENWEHQPLPTVKELVEQFKMAEKKMDWLKEARKEMSKVSGGCTELTCLYHGEKNQEIYEKYKARL